MFLAHTYQSVSYKNILLICHNWKKSWKRDPLSFLSNFKSREVSNANFNPLNIINFFIIINTCILPQSNMK